MTADDNGLVDAEGLLKALFAEGCRPSLRWVRDQQKRRAIPFVKIGHLVRFDIAQVRESISNNNTILPRSYRRTLP